jgi:hypothetical protein
MTTATLPLILRGLVEVIFSMLIVILEGIRNPLGSVDHDVDD